MLVNAASFFFVARDLDSTPRALLSAFQLETSLSSSLCVSPRYYRSSRSSSCFRLSKINLMPDLALLSPALTGSSAKSSGEEKGRNKRRKKKKRACQESGTCTR